MFKKCLFCGKSTDSLIELKEWNKDKVNFFCEVHYREVKKVQAREMHTFIEYYKDENRRSWLDEHNLKLWNNLTKKEK